MVKATLHPTAIISPEAVVASSVQVGAYAIIEEGVTIGEGTTVAPHAILKKGSQIGKEVRIDSLAVIGGDPQDLSFKKETPTGVCIGDGTVIREGVTIHRATAENACTQIGPRVYLMAYCHIAHDCQVGHSAIIANNVLLAGHVEIQPYCFMGGGTVVHQFACIGEGAMVGGGSAITRNVPPFLMVAERDKVVGLNLLGLKRRNVPTEYISDLKNCYHAVYCQGNNMLRKNAQTALEKHIAQTEPGERFLRFFLAHEKRGFVQRGRGEL